jgi:RHS repeat-associated protein
MNACQPKRAPSYGYDSPCASFQGTGAPIFSYDSSANCIAPASLEISARHAQAFLQFTGKERDLESGLDYFGARYYGSALGRFTSSDPKILSKQKLNDPQQWNGYAYVRNNPFQFVDPNGEELKFALWNNAGLSHEGAEHVAKTIANNFNNAGVAVSYEVHDGSPGLLRAINAQLNPLSSTHVFEIRDGKEGSPNIAGEDGGKNWGGQSAIDASVVQGKANGDDANFLLGLANAGTHEIAHDVLGHISDDAPAAGSNFMNGTSEGAPSWLFNPNLSFTPGQSSALQGKFNENGDYPPPPPPQPPLPPKVPQ